MLSQQNQKWPYLGTPFFLKPRTVRSGGVSLGQHGECREQGPLGGRVYLGEEMETGVGVAMGALEARESFGRPSWLLSGQQQSVF